MAIALQGISASKGIAIGKVYVVERGRLEVKETQISARAVTAEIARFKRALSAARAQLSAVKLKIPDDTPTDISAFIDTHLLMLDDSALSKVPIQHIKEQRVGAEWALKLQRDALVSVFDAMDDAYLRTRKDDVEHVVNRVQWALRHGDQGSQEDAPVDVDGKALEGRIVFADDLTPADTVLMQHQGVGGFLTEHGGPNSHTAILARSLGIPAVVGLHEARSYVRNDEVAVIDGRQGAVVLDPEEVVVRHFRQRQREIERQRVARNKLRKAPVVSTDGEAIGLQANVELPVDVAAATRAGASGIGLYRTEFLFMNREDAPGEEEQFEAYMSIVEAVKGAPVTIRTLDLGADKQVDGSRPGAPAASNPALGLRAVRLCLKDHSLFKPQLRALLRASAQHPVRMMVPMISTTQELTQVLSIVKDCQEELTSEGLEFDPDMPIGGMIEVPAAAVCADIFARHLDFLSIGTNDLIQYTIAIDRVDDEVNYLYDPLHPAVLRLVQNTIKAGQRAGIPVAMCGEMAGDARYTKLLLGLGLKEFSVHPNALLEVKQAITSSHIGNTKKLTQRFMRAVNSTAREKLFEEMSGY